MGRKNKYFTAVQPHLNEISEWYHFLTEEQIARRLGVAVSSFTKYKNNYAELREALSRGKQELIEDLKETLKKKAHGFYYTETKKFVKEVNGEKIKTVETVEKYSQPDTGAIHLLLKNLDNTWRNDDMETMNLKRKRLELEKEKAEKDSW